MIRARHSIDGLAADMARIPVQAAGEETRIVKNNVELGRDLTRTLARDSAGRHGKLYHRAITSEMNGPLEGEWGSDVNKPQGNMEFERGSRNQKPHLDHQRAADKVAPELASDTRRMLRRLFW